jgi:hypothetical protein
MVPTILTVQEKYRKKKRKALLLTAIFGSCAVAIYWQNNLKRECNMILTLPGLQWMNDLLADHPSWIKDNLGVTQEAFKHLEMLLTQKSNLQPTKYVTTREQLGIFLYAVTRDLMRKLAERFQRSTETIQRIYHKVMRAFLSKDFYKLNIQSPTILTPISNYIKDNLTFFPWFKDCVGAIDGTHIPISPPDSKKANYRNCKGFLSQNFLAVCDFEMRFTDGLCGWEGSVADSTLWIEAMRSGAVSVPDNKYLLGDAGFPNCDKCLTPYRGVRYHLQEWKRDNRGPQNAKELFNLRHSKLRSIIECVFGVMKNKYKLLSLPRFFKLKVQVQVAAALCVLHNIMVTIREVEMNVEGLKFPIEDIEEELPPEDQQFERTGYNITARERMAASLRRDAIADAMWEQYVQHRQSN